jgi:hypothetical protein
VQRWQSAGRFEDNWLVQRWFIITALVVLIILMLLLLVINLYRTAQRKKTVNLLFGHAKERGLSTGEFKMLKDIAGSAGAKHEISVFNVEGAFDRGVDRIVKKSLAKGADPSEIEVLKRNYSFLREKMGLQNPYSELSEMAARPSNPNTRQIAVGKKLLLTRRTGRTDGEIESTVVQNNDAELTVELAKHVRIDFGDLWSARYFFGSSVWEFDTSVISYDGTALVLSHGDNARYVNRRRFLRVPVRKEALIALFPFTGTVEQRVNGANTDSIHKETMEEASRSTLVAPEFVPAIVTELAGPGLRVEVSLEVKKGDRVLVVFKEEEKNGQGPIETQFDDRKWISEIVEDIGVIRHVKAMQDGYSVAVELTGLSDADIDHLVRATNAASISTVAKNQDTTAETEAGEDMLEVKIAQGV